MGDYIKLISKEKKNIYVPKKVAELSEYIRKEIESKNEIYNLFRGGKRPGDGTAIRRSSV